MKQEEFLQRLSEVAEWCRPTITQADPRRNKRGRKSLEELEWEENEAEALGEEVRSGPNETIPPMVTRIKHQPIDCPDCGKTVKGRCVQFRQCSYPVEHFRQHCKACDLWRNPFTGQFDLEQGSQLQNTFRNYWYNRMKK